ncbi:tetratricopeptide repeat protein [Moellerella wisconsensis]|nr:tetratricopeptide repeat protein [Moellerella wisconsensis]
MLRLKLYLADIIAQSEGHDKALTYINAQLQRHPTMRLFYRLMEYHLQDAEEGRAKRSLILLRKMVGEQIRTKPDYRCRKMWIYFTLVILALPSCRSWDTTKPIRGLDGQ